MVHSLQTYAPAESIGNKTTNRGFMRSPATSIFTFKKTGQLFPFLFKCTTIHYINIQEGGSGEKGKTVRVGPVELHWSSSD